MLNMTDLSALRMAVLYVYLRAATLMYSLGYNTRT